MSIPIHSPVAPDAGWAEVARLYRRICFLRAAGKLAEAARLRTTDYAAAIRAVTAASDLDVTGRIRALEEVEEERADEAAAFAEILAPLVAEKLRVAMAADPGRAAEGGPGRTAAAGKTGAARNNPGRASTDAPKGIADMIDEMLGRSSPE